MKDATILTEAVRCRRSPEQVCGCYSYRASWDEGPPSGRDPQLGRRRRPCRALPAPSFPAGRPSPRRPWSGSGRGARPPPARSAAPPEPRQKQTRVSFVQTESGHCARRSHHKDIHLHISSQLSKRFSNAVASPSLCSVCFVLNDSGFCTSAAQGVRREGNSIRKAVNKNAKKGLNNTVVKLINS